MSCLYYLYVYPVLSLYTNPRDIFKFNRDRNPTGMSILSLSLLTPLSSTPISKNLKHTLPHTCHRPLVESELNVFLSRCSRLRS